MKYALIIGNDQYIDEKLPRLITPVEDARELAKVLGDKMIGEFDEVEQVINKTTSEIRKAISRFLRNKQHDDLVLVYFSGHGVLDSQGRLHLASNDTETGYLSATAISASFVKDELSQCRSQRQILILDCCHSGAIEHGVKAAITEETFEGGYGRVILTAATETQLALEGNKVLSQTEYSLFTHFLLEGLKTGDADKDNDGIVSLDEWYSYTYTKVISQTHKQTPQLLGKKQGELFIAKNKYLKKRLPIDLIQLLKNKLPSARVAAVGELSDLLQSQDAEISQLARENLEELRKDESQAVALAAQKAIDGQTSAKEAYARAEKAAFEARIRAEELANEARIRAEMLANEVRERGKKAIEAVRKAKNKEVSSVDQKVVDASQMTKEEAYARAENAAKKARIHAEELEKEVSIRAEMLANEVREPRVSPSIEHLGTNVNANKETPTSLAQEALSELVQAELGTFTMIFNEEINNVSGYLPDLHSDLKSIAEEFKDIDIGPNTPMMILNNLISRYPKTKALKG